MQREGRAWSKLLYDADEVEVVVRRAAVGALRGVDGGGGGAMTSRLGSPEKDVWYGYDGDDVKVGV